MASSSPAFATSIAAFTSRPLLASPTKSLAVCARQARRSGRMTMLLRGTSLKPTGGTDDGDVDPADGLVLDEEDDDDVSIEDVGGLVDNANVRPMLDVNVDEGLLMYRLRKELGAEDFNRIFNPKDRRIGEVL